MFVIFSNTFSTDLVQHSVDYVTVHYLLFNPYLDLMSWTTWRRKRRRGLCALAIMLGTTFSFIVSK